MEVLSSAFQNGESIPRKYTCEGANINPPLQFKNIPPAAKSLVLMVEDPDAPSVKPWVHWVLFNIPAEVNSIDEDEVPEGGMEGITTKNTFGYHGPCPPQTQHRYFFKLYALDTRLAISDESDRKAVLKAMEGHILEEASLMGVYQLQKTRQKQM